MPKKLQKSLQECLSKIKNSDPSSKNWKISGCRHPKTPSFDIDRSRNDHGHQEEHVSKMGSSAAATLSDIDRFLLENFKSLYIKNDDDDNDHNHYNKIVEEVREEDCHNHARSTDMVLFDSPRFVEPPLHLRGSHRFFVSASSSSSLIEEARTSLTTTTITSDEGGSSSTSTRSTCDNNNADINKNVNAATLPDEYIAVKTYSRSPSEDFRRSMEEMVEAKLQEDDGKVDWDFMQELLFCYLNLNEKKSHKYILSAFVDLIIGLRQRSNRIPARQRRSSSRRERRKLRNVT